MKYTVGEQNLIALSSIVELNYKERYSALAEMRASEPDLEACKNLLIKRCDIGVYNKVKDKYLSPAFRENVLNELEARGIECVTYLSPDYPQPLKQICDPPITLFIRGRRELLKTKCFAIVGSRRSTFYAVSECSKFAKALSERFTVVTGFAAGADSAATEGAEHRVISVIAFGFDHIKSLSNYQMIRKVESNGLIISEHYPTVAPQPYLFPVRNRIIAGLSEGTLVVSAGEKSGALITANYAVENGRDVFALPYNIGISSGEGCNALIREGAILCRSPQDVLDNYGFEPPSERKIQLTEEEERALEIIKAEGEIFLPVLSEKLGVPAYKLIAVLSALEIKKLIVRLGGNRYAII